MATGEDVHRLAMALPETTASPHFDRTAYRVRRIYATLAADGSAVNVFLTPEEQAFKVMMAPEIFSQIPNGWGLRGATKVDLEKIGLSELGDVLRMAWEHGRAMSRRGS